MNTVAYTFNNALVSLAIIKESLNGFLSKSKSSRVVFGVCSIRKFNKISGRSLL